MAAYAGILSLLFVPPEIFLENMLNDSPDTHWIFFLIIFVYIISVLTTVLLYYGFYLIGDKLHVPAIKISSSIIILLNFIWYIFQVFAIQEPISFYNIFGGTVLIVFGISRILFGYGIYKVRTTLGQLAKPIAILEIVIGIFLVSVLAYFVGFFLSIIAAILQIILLFRLSKSFDENLISVDPVE